ncbi:SPOR domain-containing protein [Pseudomonas sp. 2(2015)]|uniref:SPOR domain-containing protein n=1 Tax=Pseudomonas sp. 2(2015) TaxID=1619950 RepID=UPI0005EB3FF6|nr:SPOR domain-containing protein [Pseudomonas sp. 2(2015)]KJK19400.1 cell division protein [Pseudomonas sp. 2(2015)]
MALLDKVVKQRMVGALVLVALAVIFLPMLFSREDEMRQVRVEAPEAPAVPTLPQVQVEPVQVPEPQVVPEEPLIVEQATAPVQAPSTPIAPAPAATPLPTPAPAVAAKPATPAPAKVEAKPAATVAAATKPAAGKIDANGLPVSWSIQMASLANRASADNLQKTLRSQGYNAYIRSAEGMNRVYVGPLIERAEAERLRDVINRQQKLKGFVVRFQPERS